MIWLGLFIWVFSGAVSFIFWWTKEFDFTKEELFPCFFSSWSGPLFIPLMVGIDLTINFFVNNKVLFKKRK